jgi:hypothetical protein
VSQLNGCDTVQKNQFFPVSAIETSSRILSLSRSTILFENPKRAGQWRLTLHANAAIWPI